MMKKILYFLTALTFFSAFAQDNIVPNGGFEIFNQDKPQNWYFSRFLNMEKSYDSHSGNYSAKFYPNGGSVFLVNDDFDYNVMDVESNSEYAFSYWYKGEVLDENNSPQKNILVSITWYRDDEKIKTDNFDGEQVFFTKKWQKKEFKITVPNGVNKAGLSFYVSAAKTGYIYLDDVNMVLTKKLDDNIQVPSNVSVTPYQREIELRWDKEAEPRIQWEVVVNNTETYTTKNNYFVLDNLELGQNYQIKVRAKKSGSYSDYTQAYSVQTLNLEYAIDDSYRIPRLRTLGIDAIVGKTINLYYTDLADKNAEIRYFVNDQEVFPEGNKLEFPSVGKHNLKIIIKETTDRVWEIEYRVTVREQN